MHNSKQGRPSHLNLILNRLTKDIAENRLSEKNSNHLPKISSFVSDIQDCLNQGVTETEVNTAIRRATIMNPKADIPPLGLMEKCAQRFDFDLPKSVKNTVINVRCASSDVEQVPLGIKGKLAQAGKNAFLGATDPEASPFKQSAANLTLNLTAAFVGRKATMLGFDPNEIETDAPEA